MSVLAAKQLPAPQTPDAFEALCLDVWRRLLNDPHAQVYGRGGQQQRGVDIFGRRDRSMDWVGIQCKVRRGGELRPRDIETDLEAAATMNPRLSEFVIATTARRDTTMQDLARERTARNQAVGLFVVTTFFWDDFEIFLQNDANLDLLQKHYGEFIVRLLPTGTVVSKMLSLRVGVERPDTLYELIIGKTLPRREAESPAFGLAYFKDLAFMVNLQTRTAAVFPMPMRHFSAIESTIESRQDQRIIASWLNTIGDIDGVLRIADEEQIVTITLEQWRAFDRQA
jgi:hypothetical protein